MDWRLYSELKCMTATLLNASCAANQLLVDYATCVTCSHNYRKNETISWKGLWTPTLDVLTLTNTLTRKSTP